MILVNKREYLKCIDELGLDKDKYLIISGGVMLMYGLKNETSDIDIKVTPEYFEELKKCFDIKKSSKFSYLYELTDLVEVAVLEFARDEVVWIDGYPVSSIEKELEWKIANNREKDQEAIRIIYEYLKTK